MAGSSTATPPTVALLPWGALFDEDYLDTIGVPLDVFCVESAGGHLFNFIAALATVGVRTVLVLFSRRVARPTRFVNAATGATVLVVPASRLYRTLRTVLGVRLVRRVLRVPGLAVREVIEEAVSYLATPLASLARELRAEHCGAIVCQEYEFVRFDACVLLGRVLRVPVFASFQGGDRRRGRLQRISRPWAMRHGAGAIIAPTTEIARVRAEYGTPMASIAQIFNAVEPSAFEQRPRADARADARAALGLSAFARVVVWHGRVERDVKGLDVLMDAWGIVCRARPEADLRLLLVGTGRDAAWLRERLTSPDVRSATWRDEFVTDRAVLQRYLAAGDVYAFPSRHEGFAVAPLEAMACGLAIVAADASGIPDLIGGGDASGGIVVPRGDPDRFADALGRLLDDSALARTMGVRARARVEACCSIERVGTRLRDFLLGPSPGAGDELGERPAHERATAAGAPRP